jgi:hypothetical protein
MSSKSWMVPAQLCGGVGRMSCRCTVMPEQGNILPMRELATLIVVYKKLLASSASLGPCTNLEQFNSRDWAAAVI